MEKDLLHLLRRLYDKESLGQMESIIEEGIYYTNFCDFIDDLKGYIEDVLIGSAITFINSNMMIGYNQQDQKILNDLVPDIVKIMRKKFNGIISREYYYRMDNIEDECGETDHNF